MDIFRKSTDPLYNRNRNSEYFKLKLEIPDVTQQDAFNLIEGIETPKCSCGKDAKFVSLKLGYSKYCSEPCYDKDNGYTLEEITAKVKDGWKPSTKHFIKIKNATGLTSKELYDIVYGKGKCEHCGKESNFLLFTTGYTKFCSISCANISRNIKKKTAEETKLISEKRENTNLERYGVKSNLQLIDNTGDKNIMHKNNTSEKSLYAKKKKLKTTEERYGREYVYTANVINHQDLNLEFLTNNFVTDNKFDVVSAMEYFNCSSTYFNKFDLPKKVNYGEEWLFNLIGGNTIRNDRTFIKPLELDILNHDYKIAVEFDGLAFHSSGYSKSSIFNKSDEPKQHVNKTELVEKHGYQLFHVFENEYLDPLSRKKWESAIKSKTNKSDTTIYARKCKIVEVSSNDARQFENDNHLQGAGISSIRLGLIYNDELVSLMTFGKSRFNKNYEYELIRFCSLLNHNIPGGFSKLLKYFEIKYNPKSLISYANRRWSQGNVYIKNGFTHIHTAGPNYFYFIPSEKILYSRNKFQKHKLSELLENFDSSLTETENMFNNGYRKIYDCGNLVFVKEYQ